MIEREWVSRNNNIPHFANVVKSVDPNEGVEITMNCNSIAFHWIIEFVRLKTNGDDLIVKRQATAQGLSSYNKEVLKNETETTLYEKMDEISNENCLNILVTSFFLQLTWVYDMVWDYYFARNFSDVLNNCRISLSNINPVLVKDMGTKISESELEKLTERKDKLISNIYKSRIEELVVNAGIDIYWCSKCQRLLTKE